MVKNFRRLPSKLGQQEYSFTYKDQAVNLIGDQDLRVSPLNQVKHSPLFEDELDSGIAKQTTLLVNRVFVPAEIEHILSMFSHVFTEPIGLPPLRGRDHAINLLPGMGAVSVRPYRYPYSQKEIMEKMVKEMMVA